MQRFLILLIYISIQLRLNSSQCLPGTPGRNGEVRYLTSNPWVNGTSFSTFLQVKQRANCNELVANDARLQICDGAAGPPGQQGETGIEGDPGPAASIMALGACVYFNGEVRLCNGSAQLGPRGAQGPTGQPGLPGIQGPIGIPAIVRVVGGADGSYAATRAGLQAAIDSAANAGGGTVYVAVPQIVSDCTSLVLKSGVFLDFLGGEFALPATPDTCYGFSFAASTNGFTLIANASEGTSVLKVSPWTGNQIVPGQMGYIGSYEVLVVQSVVPASGIIQLRSALANTYNVGATFNRFANSIVNAGLRNAVLNANNNTGTGSVLLFLQGMSKVVFDTVTITGTMAGVNGPASCSGLCVFMMADCVFKNIRSRDFNVVPNSQARDICFGQQTTTTITDVQSTNGGGFGPNIAWAVYATANDIRTEYSKARGFRIDTTSYSGVQNLVTVNHQTVRGVGLFMSAFGTRTTTVSNVMALGNAQEGIGIDGSVGENYNQLFGFVSNGNAAGGVTLNSGPGFPAAGNFFMGATNGGISSDGGSEPLPNCFWIQTNGQGGAEYLHINQPATTDFVSGGSSAWLVVSMDGTNSKLVFSVRGTDGVVRRASLTIA